MAGKKAQIVGWRYFLGMHMVLCRGPVDEVQSISFADREAWTGPQVGSGTIYVNKPNLFGGKQREGGVAGTINVAMGEDTQLANDYLQSRLGDVPAFRGLAALVFRKFEIGSNNPYVKKLAVRVKRINTGWETAPWYLTKAGIGGAMNGAHIIYQCLTSSEWGMGYPIGSVDTASFTGAADTLYAEGFGLCMSWNRQAKIEAFVGDVLDHIGGMLRPDPTTGLFQLVLLRDDYTIGSLPLFNEDNSTLTEFQRPNWGETTNEVVVKYTDMNSGLEKVIAVQDLANISIQGSVVSVTKEYLGIVSADVAGRIAVRDLRASSTPLAKVTIYANRKNYGVTNGSVVRLSNLEKGIVDMPIRVLKVSYGGLLSGGMTIEGVEDIFGLPTTSYVEPQGIEWSSPEIAPVVATQYMPIEIPYWEVNRASSAADFSQLDDLSSFVSMAVSRPVVGMHNYLISVYDAVSGEYEDDAGAEFCPTCQVVGAINEVQESLTYTNAIDISLVALDTYAYLDNEVILIVGINTITSVLTVKRGMMDTVPARHVSGSLVWFVEEYLAESNTERLAGATVNTKILTVSSAGVLDPVLAPVVPVVLVGRFGMPYPPANVQINAELYPEEVLDTMVLTWAHRDRTLQVGPTLVTQTDGDIGPEVGVTYSVRVIRVSDSAVLYSVDGETAGGHTPALPSMSVTPVEVRVYSVRDGISSMQYHSIYTDFSKAAATRLTEDTVDRYTEDDILRTIE